MMLKKDILIVKDIQKILSDITVETANEVFMDVISMIVETGIYPIYLEETFMNMDEKYKLLFILQPMLSTDIGMFSDVNKVKVFRTLSESVTLWWDEKEFLDVSIFDILNKYGLAEIFMKNLFSFNLLHLVNFNTFNCRIMLVRLCNVYRYIDTFTSFSSDQMKINFDNNFTWDISSMTMSFKSAHNKYGNFISIYASEFIAAYEHKGLFRYLNIIDWDVLKYGGDIKKFLGWKYPKVIEDIDKFMEGHERYYLDNDIDLSNDFYYDLKELLETLKIHFAYDPILFNDHYFIVEELRETLNIIIKVCQIQKLLREIIYTSIHVKGIYNISVILNECLVYGISCSLLGDFEEVSCYGVEQLFGSGNC